MRKTRVIKKKTITPKCLHGKDKNVSFIMKQHMCKDLTVNLIQQKYYWFLDSRQNVHNIHMDTTVGVRWYNSKGKYSQAASRLNISVRNDPNTFLIHLKTCKYTFHTLINTIGCKASQWLHLLCIKCSAGSKVL